MPAGGKRQGAGRKPKGTVAGQPLPPLPSNSDEIGELIHTLEDPPKPDEAEKNVRAAGWRRFWDSIDLDVALKARMFLYDHWRGKARHTVNHLHDKPIEHNVTISYADTIAKARKRARL